MAVEWHRLAITDLAEIVAYIAHDNLEAAYRVHDEVLRQTDMLAIYGEMGRAGRLSGTRELVIAGTPYVAAYRIEGGTVTVLRLLHGARQWPGEV